MEEFKPLNLLETKEIKLELKEVKPEPLNDDYFLSTMPKQEPQWKPVTATRITFDDRNFTQNVPKLEEQQNARKETITENAGLRNDRLSKISDSRTSKNCSNIPKTYCERWTETAKLILKEDQAKKRRHKRGEARCKVCFQMKPRARLRTMSAIGQRQLIAIGCTLQNVPYLLPNTAVVHICHSHFEPCFKAICDALKINDLWEIANCTAESIEGFMKTANSLFPNLTFAQIGTSLRYFVGKNSSLLGEEDEKKEVSENLKLIAQSLKLEF